MAAFQIILQSLGLSGLKPVVYRSQFQSEYPAQSGSEYQVPDVPVYGNMAGDDVDSARKSWLGTPVFSDVAIESEGEQYDIVLETVLIDVSQRKNIVTTAVQGRNGTVKEYVSDGDYDVRLRGAIVFNGGSLYPSSPVRDLHQVLSQPKALKIASDYLRLFNIYSIVVTGYKFGQQEGFQNVQTFEIDCISDSPDELVEEDATTNQ